MEEVRTDDVVAVTAIRDLLNHADTRTEGLAATAAVAAIPDMVGSIPIRTAVKVGSISRAGQRTEKP